MRARLASALWVAWLACSTAPARADPPPAQVWIAPGDPAVADAARGGLERALHARGRVMREVVVAPNDEPRLAGDLERALADYAALKLDAALAGLTAVSAAAQKLGGGDLDGHALSDLYLYLALSAQELGQNDAAWDAFVRSVRIDPTRALDPARIPPRATASHRRAQLELGQLPAVELELRLPAGARTRIDGDEGHGPGPVGRRLVPGPHFVRVDAPGFLPWRGMVTLSAPNEVFAPNLRPLEAPTFADEADALSARLDRTAEGWRLSLRGRAAGVALEASAPFRAQGADLLAARLVDRVMGPPVAPRTPTWKRWWPWTIAAVGVAAIAIAVPIALTRGGGTIPGSAGGSVEPFR